MLENSIEINPLYEFTNLWYLIENDKLTYDFIYQVTNDIEFLMSFEKVLYQVMNNKYITFK
jgi:hypothetical protein